MSSTVSVTEAELFQVVGTFLQQILDSTVAVVRGQQNLVPEPQGSDFVVMWPLMKERLETNVDSYDPVAATKSLLQPIKRPLQLDVHGPNSSDNSDLITTLFRDEYGASAFSSICANVGSGIEIQPLFADEPRQMPFMNAEQQLEERWICTIYLQVNQAVVVPQQFADVVEVKLISVDEAYPIV